MSRDSTLVDSGARRRQEPGHAQEGDGDDTVGLSRPDAELDRLARRRGETLGRYVLLEPIGRGGMGVVYSAYDPELDRRVALKLLRSDEDERGRARLVREAQAMAKLVHPHVITVHDVGAFAGGVFVAMELLDGMDLRRWLALGPHPWREVLRVFTQAGEGLGAAHRAGLVHRDFKPGNVLLGKGGEVKVVDFGLARQLDGGLDTSELRALERGLERSLTVSGTPVSGSWDEELTGTGTLLGTPAYMAPEQHARKELDARSDQFSFCVALYEALFGQRPFGGEGRVALAVQTNRGEVRPLPKGHAVPVHVTRAVLRGLRPDPRERFASMPELLDALRYDPRQRQRRIAAGAAAVLLVGVASYGYVRGPAAKPPACRDDPAALAGAWDDAQQQALWRAFEASTLPYASDTARYVTTRLDAWAERWHGEERRACEATHVHHTQPEPQLTLRRACLQRQRKDLAAVTRLLAEGDPQTIERADRMVASLPTPEACGDTDTLSRLAPPTDEGVRRQVDEIRDELAEIRALRHAGRYPEGLRRARALRDRVERIDHLPVVAEVLGELGDQQSRSEDRTHAADTLHAAAQAAAEARHDEVLAETWLNLAWTVGLDEGRPEEGLRWAGYAEAVVNRMGRPAGLRSELLCTQGNLRAAKGDHEAALEALQTCLRLRERTMPDDPLVANTLGYLGNTQVRLGRVEQAEASFRRGLAVATAAHGPVHPLVASMHNGLGVALYHIHRVAEAEAQYQRAYEIDLAVLGPDHPDLLYSLGNIANCRRERGELQAALEAMRRVEALVTEAFPPVHREVGMTAHNVAELLALLDRPQEALARYDHALAVRTEVHGPDDPYVANTLTGRAEVLLSLQRAEEARTNLERALVIRETSGDPNRHEHGRTRFGLARALWDTNGDRARARALAEAAKADLAEGDSPLTRQRREALDAWLRGHAIEEALDRPPASEASGADRGG